MCFEDTHKQISKYAEKKYRLADFFNSHWDTYVKSPSKFIKPEQYKAVNAIRVCRTAALGVDVHACKECGQVSEVYYSCKHRFCPTCSWMDTVKWAEKAKHRMLNAPHRHIVCTLPHSLNGLIKRNQNQLLSALMRSSADTFKDWMLNKYGIKIGIISVLHTFGEKKNFHAHVHMIVSWAGVDSKTNELKILDNPYVNYPFLKKKFRCKFEDEMVSMFDRGYLNHDFVNREEFMDYLKKVNKKDWNLHLELPMDTPEDVIRYIGRYSKRACLSEYKITSIDGDYISFQYKDNRDRDSNKKPKEKILTAHYRDFFPLLLQHVPLPYFKIVRNYGIYSNKGSAPEEYFNKESDKSTENEEESTSEDSRYCKDCGIEKDYLYTVFDKRKIADRKTKFNIDTDIHIIIDRNLYIQKRAA